MVDIRLAEPHEFDWINKKYEEIDFMPSVLSKDCVAIAESNNEKVGLGRLVSINKSCLELGGIYIFEKFRQQGIARKMVNYLLHQRKSSTAIVYCLPFESLKNFYESCGFVSCSSNEELPEEIKAKHEWCNKAYKQKVLVLKL